MLCILYIYTYKRNEKIQIHHMCQKGSFLCDKLQPCDCKPLREIEPLSTAGFIDTQMQWSVTLSCLLYSLALPSITRSALKCMPHSLRRFSLSPRIAAYSLSCQNALQKKQIAEISRDNFHRSPYCPIAHNNGCRRTVNCKRSIICRLYYF